MRASSGLSTDGWRRLARACERIGATAFACLFTWQLILFFYYIWDRPLEPQPSLGRTVLLGWGRYGSLREAANLSRLMWWGFIAFGVVAVGQGIRIYKLGENLLGKAKKF